MATDIGHGAAVQGVSWDLASEYPAPDSAEIEADLARLSELLEEVERLNAVLVPLLGIAGGLSVETAKSGIEAAREVFVLAEEAGRLLRDPGVYADCRLSVDSEDEGAQALRGRLQGFRKRFAELSEPLSQFLDRAPDAVVEGWLADEATAPARFTVEHSRKRRHELLSLEEETLAASLAEDGIHAWGRLYNQLSGTLSCEVTVGNERRVMGLAEASGLTLKPDDTLREDAWRAINRAWEDHAESCAAAINAIAGWRLEMCRRRSRGGRAGRTSSTLPCTSTASRGRLSTRSSRSLRGSRSPRPSCRPAEGPRLRKGALRPLGPARAGPRNRRSLTEREARRSRTPRRWTSLHRRTARLPRAWASS